MTPSTAFGRHMRHWRQIRGVSQLRLATEAELSQRHVSFIETGRSRPGPDVVHRISEVLGIPLRERNQLLESAGLAAAYPERPMDGQDLAPFRAAIDRMLETHDPFPAYVVNRWWDLIDANRAGRAMLPVDWSQAASAIDLFLAPGPMRDMLENFAEVGWTFFDRLRDEARLAPGDERMMDCIQRARRWLEGTSRPEKTGGELVICPILRIGEQRIRTLSMVARFGNAQEITTDELRVELVYPQDEAARAFFAMAAGS